MSSFEDNSGRAWDLQIDALAITRIREECDPQFLLADETGDSTCERLARDPAMLCRVVFLLTAKQRRERSVSEEDFYIQVVGVAIDEATRALIAAMVTFSPRRVGLLLEASAATRDRIRQALTDRALEGLRDQQLEKSILLALDQKLTAAIESMLPPAVSPAAAAVETPLAD